LTRITSTLHEYQYIFFIISRSFLLRMKNVSGENYVENRNACVQLLFPPQNRAVYETMLKNTVKPHRPQITIRSMRIAGWIPKATNTHSEYVILIAFHYNNGLRTRLNVTLYLHLPVL